MKKHLLRLRPLLLLFAAFFLLTNCEDDFEDRSGVMPNQQQFKGPVNELTYLKGDGLLKAKALLLEELQRTNAPLGLNNSTARVTSLTGWEIDFSEVLFIGDTVGNKNYTFRVTHPDMTDDVFYNLCYSEIKGSVSIRLIRYEMSAQFAEDYYTGNANIGTFKGTIIISPILDSSADWPVDPTPPHTTPDPVDPCDEDVVIDVPDTPPHTGGGGPPPVSPGNGVVAPGNGSSSGGGSGSTVSISDAAAADCIEIVQTPCSEHQHWGYDPNCQAAQQGGVYIWNSCTGEEIFSGRLNGAAGLPAFNPNPVVNDPCAPGNAIGLLGPIISIKTDSKNCEELASKSADVNFQAKMADLKTKAGTQNFESAYTIYQNAVTGLSFSNITNGSLESPKVDLTLTQSGTQSYGNAIGFMHCHLDNGTTYKVFSLDDIEAFGIMNALSTREPREKVLYVVTASGTFALKISNKAMFDNASVKLQYSHDDHEKDYRSEVFLSDTMEKQTLGFLKFMKKSFEPEGGLGLDLYQQNADGTWDKLTLKANGKEIIKKRC